MEEILAKIRDIISEDENKPAPIVGRPVGNGEAREAEKPAGDDDVLELTQALNEDGSVRHLAPIGGSAGREAIDAPRPELRVDPLPEPHSEPTLGPLMSDVSSYAAAASFAHLAAAPPRPAAAQAAPRLGDLTLEESVQQLLRPLLQAWLDKNLPDIVERLVKAEIDRVVERSGVG